MESTATSDSTVDNLEIYLELPGVILIGSTGYGGEFKDLIGSTGCSG